MSSSELLRDLRPRTLNQVSHLSNRINKQQSNNNKFNLQQQLTMKDQTNARNQTPLAATDVAAEFGSTGADTSFRKAPYKLI